MISVKHSVRFKFTCIFIGVTAVAIISCILVNLYFLEDFYLNHKQKIVLNAVNELNQVWDEQWNEADENSGENDSNEVASSLGQQRIYDLLGKLRDTYNISALIYGTDGTIGFNSSPDTTMLKNRLEQYIYQDNNSIHGEKVYESSLYQMMIVDGERTGSNYLECWGFLNAGALFILSTPVESIQDSVAVSNRFYSLIGAVVILISAVYMFFMTKRLTSPILKLASLSERMARLDFTARYQGEVRDEIGVLGDSMNHLSDRLEETIGQLQSANEQLQRDIEEKIQIDDMRKEFLANVSHELKTPIALIQGYAEGLKDCINEDEESRDFYCEVIMDEAAKMNLMVKKLLTLNHLEFGNQQAEREVFNLTAQIQGVLNSTEILMQQKSVDLTFTPMAEEVLVWADEFRMEEVLRNYVSNALNHLAGSHKITICMKDVENRDKMGKEIPDQKRRIRVSVFNSGEPIPEEELEKVWIKFYKVDKARTREYGGSGIGLSIVKAIMENHGCDYGVYNVTEGETGVVFWFDIDRAPES